MDEKNNIFALYEKIKSLKIQGATNVAESVLLAMIKLSDNPTYSLKEVINGGEKLAFARPTEPLAQNFLHFIKKRAKEKRDIIILSQYLQDLLKNVKEKITKNLERKIIDGGLYLTHCHSSTTTNGFIAAFKNGKKLRVIATETRPLYQGRITVQELAKAGIPTILIIDSASFSAIINRLFGKVDAVFVGFDMLTKEGNLVNKIGTAGIAIAANIAKVPLYATGTLMKFSQNFLKKEIVEERLPGEVWKNPPKRVKIYNPAFEQVSIKYISSIICEFGKIKPQKVYSFVKDRYSWII